MSATWPSALGPGLDAYRELKPIARFEDVAKITLYSRVPSTWSVVLSDIRGSTDAIEAGRYKDVNLVGAATIAVIQNALGSRDFPFVFGGDGASAVLPADACASVIPELCRLQRHSQSAFGLELRVGVVPVAAIEAAGASVSLARYQIGPNATIAVFQGGGLQQAEHLLKRDPTGARFYLKDDGSASAPSLETLSCRWRPIPSRNGSMVSVLAQALSPVLAEHPAVYASILEEMASIVGEIESRPVAFYGMKLESFSSSVRRELALRSDLDWRGLVRKIIVPMIVSRLIIRFPWLPGGGVFKRYLADAMTSSDYRKMDDALRMVLDCSEEQAAALESALEARHRAGEVAYGLHRSSAAIMTCLVESLEAGHHLHFIDGADGGYAMASRDMKRRLAEQERRSRSGPSPSGLV